MNGKQVKDFETGSHDLFEGIILACAWRD